MTQEQCEKALSLLTGVLDYECFEDVNMVIEARTISPTPQLKLHERNG